MKSPDLPKKSTLLLLVLVRRQESGSNATAGSDVEAVVASSKNGRAAIAVRLE